MLDYKDPDDAIHALMPRVGATKLPSSSAYEAERAPWIAALNSAAGEESAMPLRCSTPALMLELFGSFYRRLHETAKALGIEKE